MPSHPRSVSSSEVLAGRSTVGWVPENGGRGTLSLIITCTFTIFLCTWAVIHPRVTQKPLIRNLHKLALFFKTVVAPEFIAVESLQEWSQARKMVRNCAGQTGGRLKLVHAFYIGMLALKYRTPQGERVIWPNQYEWLLKEGLVKWEDHAAWGLSEENIEDKNKSDGVVKLAALLQVSWFLTQCIMRSAHVLPLSQYESMTIGYIPLFAISYFCWWVKPKDIMVASLVDLPRMRPDQLRTFALLAVSNVFDSEEAEEQKISRIVWQLTPRVFEKEAQDEALRRAQEMGLQKYLQKTDNWANSEAETRYYDKEALIALPEALVILQQEVVITHWDPEIYHSRILWPLACLFGASFGALHLICWNSHFPTVVEMWLWRGASISSIVTLLIFMHFEKIVIRWGGLLSMVSIISLVLYFLSRIIMMAGVIAAFRSMEPKIYETYVVSDYWISIF